MLVIALPSWRASASASLSTRTNFRSSLAEYPERGVLVSTGRISASISGHYLPLSTTCDHLRPTWPVAQCAHTGDHQEQKAHCFLVVSACLLVKTFRASSALLFQA